jgi:uncharacterized membrane protein
MMGRLPLLRTLWRRVWTAMWFLPAAIVVASMALAFVLIWLEPSVGWLKSLSPRLFEVSAEGARDVLTAIATSMLGVAGVVFSITIATLTLTSQQFTSRVLRAFVTDRGNQIVLGSFLGAFAYSLVVLRTIRSPDEGEGYVPETALLGAIGMALLGVGVLIYFISHIATSIQASQVVARIARETMAALDYSASRSDTDEFPEGREETEPLCDVRAGAHGYVRRVDLRALGRLASDNGWVVHVRPRVGAFVVDDDVLLRVCRADDRARVVEERERRALRRAVTLGVTGDVLEDPSFGIRQLVDVALRALSPGVNDTTTAVTCIDYLGAVLHKAALQDRSGSTWRDAEGRPRVLASGFRFEGLLAEAFDQIREHGAGNVAVVRRLLGVAERLEGDTGDPHRRQALTLQVERLYTESQARVQGIEDRRELSRRGQRLLAALRDDRPRLTAA